MNAEPVIIIGAGLAGLCCARRLSSNQVPCVVLEASDAVGGRVRTDKLDGFLLDRGFQVLQTAYPEAQSMLDYASLQLHPFDPGATIRTKNRWAKMVDPARRPSMVFQTLFNGVGNFADRWRLLLMKRRLTSTATYDGPDVATQEYLTSRCKFSNDFVERFMRPWISGMFFDDDLRTSSHFFQFVFRMLSIGDAAMPENGMESIPIQLASGFDIDSIRHSSLIDTAWGPTELQALPAVATIEPEDAGGGASKTVRSQAEPGNEHIGCAVQREVSSIRLNCPVDRIDGSRVICRTGETIHARAIVIATDAYTASQLTNGAVQPPSFGATTCLYFAADDSPKLGKLLALNGDKEGPISNVCVPSNVAPSYAPKDQSLICVSVRNGYFERNDLEQQVLDQLQSWFGPEVKSWHLLRRYDLPRAIPFQAPGKATATHSFQLAENLFLCGDYLTTASINGAMSSGTQTAEAILLALQTNHAKNWG